MNKLTHVSAGWAKLVYDAIKKEGLDADALFKQFDIDAGNFQDASASLKQDSFSKVWQEATRISGNPAIGLRMGENPTMSSFDAFSYSLMSSDNLKDCIDRFIRFQTIAGAGLTNVSAKHTSKGFCIYITLKPDELPDAYQGFDGTLAMMLFAGRYLTNNHIVPAQVDFVHPEPANTTPYQEFFQCPLVFSAEHYGYYLKEEDLNLPFIFANAQMAAHHDEIVSASMKNMGNIKLSEQISRLIEQKLPSGEPSTQAIADALNLSVRTLQRRLKTENLNYQAVLNNTRKALAHRYLLDPNIHLQEITYLLGFCEHSSFYRAFKRWYGCTPGDYRTNAA